MLIYQVKHNPNDINNGVYFLPCTGIKVDLSKTDYLHPLEVPEDQAISLLRSSNIKRMTEKTLEKAEVALREREEQIEKDREELAEYRIMKAKKLKDEKEKAEALAKAKEDAEEHETPALVEPIVEEDVIPKLNYEDMDRADIWSIVKEKGFTGKWNDTSKDEMLEWLNAL